MSCNENIGKQRKKLLTNQGYRFYKNNNWVAVYRPWFNQIWTNPFEPKKSINRALIEEFSHNVTCRARPLQLLPVMNWIDGRYQQPDNTPEFRDIAETVAIAIYPLAMSRPVSRRNLPRKVPEQYRKLACRVIDLAKKFALKIDDKTNTHDINRDVLWALITLLCYTVPLRPGKCPAILNLLEYLEPPEKCNSSHDMFEFLLGKVGAYVRSNRVSEIGFTITRANDPHMMISLLFQVFHSVLSSQPELQKITAIFPILQYLLSLGNSTLLSMYWLRYRKGKIFATVEIWHETHEHLKATEESMPLVFESPNLQTKYCVARKFYREVFEYVRKFSLKPVPFNVYNLFEKMLNEFPAMLHNYLYGESGKACDCYHCNKIFYTDKKLMGKAQKLFDLDKKVKNQLINSAKSYQTWLLHGGLDQVRYVFHHRFKVSLPVIHDGTNFKTRYRKRKSMPWLEIVS